MHNAAWILIYVSDAVMYVIICDISFECISDVCSCKYYADLCTCLYFQGIANGYLQ